MHWERDAGGLQVGSELLRAVTGDTGISASFAVDFRKDPAADDTLSLAFGLRDADAFAYRTYLPYTVSPATREWLDASIEAGHVDSAAFTYHAVFSRPDRPFSYAMQLGLDLRDAAVSYHPDWPEVSGAAGRVLVDERRVRVWAGSGRMLQSDLRNATVEVLPRRDERRLRLGAELGGDLADGLRVINTSPLAKMTGGALRSWQASGAMALRLDLDMPFGGRLTPETSRLDLTADIEGARLVIADLRLPFDGVQGRLGFDLERGLHSERLDGRLWGQPLRAAIAAAEGPEHRIAIRVDGAAELPRVAEWLGWDLDEYLSGVAPFSVDIAQQPQHGFGFVLRSSLAGAASTLPAPLAKASADPLPLELRWSPVAAGTDLSLQLGMGIWGLMHRDPQGRFSGEIALGAEPVAGGEDLRIRGRVPQADAGAWIVAVQHVVAANAAREDGPRTVLRLDGLELESATLLGAELHALRVDSRWAERDFVLGFASDALSGEFRLPADPAARLALTLEQLQLRAFLGPAAATPVAGEAAGGASLARDAAGLARPAGCAPARHRRAGTSRGTRRQGPRRVDVPHRVRGRCAGDDGRARHAARPAARRHRQGQRRQLPPALDRGRAAQRARRGIAQCRHRAVFRCLGLCERAGRPQGKGRYRLQLARQSGAVRDGAGQRHGGFLLA